MKIPTYHFGIIDIEPAKVLEIWENSPTARPEVSHIVYTAGRASEAERRGYAVARQYAEALSLESGKPILRFVPVNRKYLVLAEEPRIPDTATETEGRQATLTCNEDAAGDFAPITRGV